MRGARLRHGLQSAGIEQPALDARLLVGAALRLDLTGLVTQAARQLTAEEAARLEASAKRRLAHEPVARILGAREFWGLPFQLSEATLVPRPDTETVVELALEIFRGLTISGQRPRIADIGTGSGAILLALLHEIPGAFGVGTDLSLTALKTARDNAAALGLADRASFVACSYAAALRRPVRPHRLEPALHPVGRNSETEHRGARARSASGARWRQ
ncbi:HemK-like putative methylase [Bradyrhizobium sp. LB9.1b]